MKEIDLKRRRTEDGWEEEEDIWGRRRGDQEEGKGEYSIRYNNI